MKLLEESTGENFCDLGLGEEFFDRTSKARSSLRAWNWGPREGMTSSGSLPCLNIGSPSDSRGVRAVLSGTFFSVFWTNSVGIGSPLWCRETRLRSAPGPWCCDQEERREKGQVSRAAVGTCSVLCPEPPQCLSQRFSGLLSR